MIPRRKMRKVTQYLFDRYRLNSYLKVSRATV